jgi:hypothetical protein
MVSQSRLGWPATLTAFFVLSLSLLNGAAGAPAPPWEEDKRPRITEQQYTDYVRQYYPESDKYLFYTGGAEDDVRNFIKKNPGQGYNYYGTVFNADSQEHPWYKAFDESKVQDDGDASSSVLAKEKARGRPGRGPEPVHLFGGIEYKEKGQGSFFVTKEYDYLRQGMESGRLSDIHHMAPGAERIDDIMAKEDRYGRKTYYNGYTSSSKNARGPYCSRKRDEVLLPRQGGLCEVRTPGKKDRNAAPKTPTDADNNKTPAKFPGPATPNTDSDSKPKFPGPATPKTPTNPKTPPSVPNTPTRPRIGKFGGF